MLDLPGTGRTHPAKQPQEAQLRDQDLTSTVCVSRRNVGAIASSRRRRARVVSRPDSPEPAWEAAACSAGEDGSPGSSRTRDFIRDNDAYAS
jgi:hypothetical protein